MVSTDDGPGAQLDTILGHLTGTLLTVVAGSAEQSCRVTEVVIYDRRDDAAPRSGAMLLCVGAGETDLPDLIGRATAVKAAAVVLRAPVAFDEETRSVVERSGIVLLGLANGASWEQLVVLMRSLLSTTVGGGDGVELLAGMPAEDSFALANAIAALLDAPITIEDRDSQILAFSGRQNEADQSRIETILGRVVPQHLRHLQERAGVFKELYNTDRPIFIDTPKIEGVPGLPRVAVAIRAGDQVLGSIWVAVREPLSSEKEQILSDAAKVVALHLLRHQIGVDVDRQVRADLVATALAAGPTALGAIERLRLAERPVTVLGMAIHRKFPADMAAGHADRRDLERTADGLALHLSVVSPGSVAALVGDVCYAIMPSSAGRGTEDLSENASRIAADFLHRARNNGSASVVIGIGRVVDSANSGDLCRSRQDADRTLRVLQQRNGNGVARFHDVQMDAVLQAIGDLLRSEGGLLPGPIARLQKYDQENGTTMTETLTMWLDNLGNALSASTSMNVHANTFRYRLRRAAEIAKIDLDDPEERFAAMLELRIAQRPFPNNH